MSARVFGAGSEIYVFAPQSAPVDRRHEGVFGWIRMKGLRSREYRAASLTAYLGDRWGDRDLESRVKLPNAENSEQGFSNNHLPPKSSSYWIDVCFALNH